MAGSGKPPLNTRKVGAMDNSAGEELIRSILFTRDFKEKDDRREDMFAATPVLDTLKSMLALPIRENLKVMVIDV